MQGTFYQPELNRVSVTDQTVYRIEKVLRRRRNEAMVKWMGLSSKFNSWIPTSATAAVVVDIHDASLTGAAGNILLVDVENACLVVRGHASF